ncbi:MAG: hypothetical protein ACXVBH_09885, partial [Flavisolibacter sp.]
MKINKSVIKSVRANLVVGFLLLSFHSFSQQLQVNDSGYFEKRGVNVFVFSGQYNGMFFDEKTAGIEIIHHGVRTVTGGAVRLQNTPEQWDLIPVLSNRKVDRATNTIEATLTYKEFNFSSRLVVTSKNGGVEISIYLDQPVPQQLQ